MTQHPRHPRPARRRLPPAATVLAGLALLAGCATIPTQTEPSPLPFGNGQSAAASVPQPPEGVSPLDLVQDWVRDGGSPVGKHAAARAYLANSSKASWNDALSLTIVDDNVITEPGPPVPGHTGSEQTVLLRGQTIGELGADNGFQPQFTSLELPITVAKQADGDWRIVHPPDGVVLTETEFQLYYQQVKIYFFDPFFGALVPDLRYIAEDPQSDEPARVIDLLLSGPSDAMANAVRSAIPNSVTTKTVPAIDPTNGAIVVNLANLNDQTEHNKQLIIAQIVMSLHQVSPGPVIVQSDGVSLVAGHDKWVAADLPSYNATTTPSAGQPGLVAAHGRLFSLKDGSVVPGGAGDGSYQVITGAQSEDGSELALVCAGPSGEQLRVGGYGKSDAVVDLPATQLTRPTWAPGDAAGDPSNQVWTVADGQSVVQVLNTQQNTWIANNVDASALVTFGQITDLRLSRDGTRVAAIAGGHLLVGAVVTDPQSGAVAIKQVSPLQADNITNAVSVDWLDQATLAVATSQPNLPVVTVSVDGFTFYKYAANLTTPTAITAAEARPIVVADSSGIWQTSDSGDLWEAMVLAHDPGGPEIPFYPG